MGLEDVKVSLDTDMPVEGNNADDDIQHLAASNHVKKE